MEPLRPPPFSALIGVMKLRLREIRERRGISQRQLADAIGLSHAAVSRLETQDAATLMKLERAARVLGVTLTDLFSERPEGVGELEALYLALPDRERRAMLDLARTLARKEAS